MDYSDFYGQVVSYSDGIISGVMVVRDIQEHDGKVELIGGDNNSVILLDTAKITLESEGEN